MPIVKNLIALWFVGKTRQPIPPMLFKALAGMVATLLTLLILFQLLFLLTGTVLWIIYMLLLSLGMPLLIAATGVSGILICLCLALYFGACRSWILAQDAIKTSINRPSFLGNFPETILNAFFNGYKR